MLIKYMSNIDHLGLDAYTLRTFFTVLDEISVSRAAERLGVSQSAVSHTLDKLRTIFEDPLFVRVGRGIEPTARARALRAWVESVLDDLKSLTDQRKFDPLSEKMEFTVATNDFPLQLIFPKLLKELSDEGINPRVRFICGLGSDEIFGVLKPEKVSQPERVGQPSGKLSCDKWHARFTPAQASRRVAQSLTRSRGWGFFRYFLPAGVPAQL